MNYLVPSEIEQQVFKVIQVLEHRLSKNLKALYLYGSALDGGLKPESDVDLFAVVSEPLDTFARQALMLELLNISSPVGRGLPWRPLELTLVSFTEIKPWRHPARRELQFGEWLRRDISKGIFEAGVLDPDLAILITKISNHSLALLGSPAKIFFDEVPQKDFVETLGRTIELWNSEDDLRGDERNIVLTLARIWFSASSGKIAPKDVAANWLLPQIPPEHQEILREARDGYLGLRKDALDAKDEKLTAFVIFAKTQIRTLLDKGSEEN